MPQITYPLISVAAGNMVNLEYGRTAVIAAKGFSLRGRVESTVPRTLALDLAVHIGR